MENKNSPMLELLLRPAFCVKDGLITEINQAAAAFLLCEGTPVLPLIATGAEEYENFREGCLYLTLSLSGHTVEATVLSMEECHLFVLEQSGEKPELQALALAARELRGSLSGMAAAANRLLSNPERTPEPLAQLNRRLYQMMRTVSNMSDAIIYCQCDSVPTEYVEICDFLEELLEKAAVLLRHIGLQLEWELPQEAIYTTADREKLERSVYNLLSNAAKHTPIGGRITVQLQRRGRLYLSVTDSGTGLNAAAKANAYERYLRTPTLTDGGEGLGLGLVLVRATALLHGGTVLIDHPEGGGTRVTMTLSIRHQKTPQMRTPVLRIDYAGERDHALQELADVLPASLYSPENLQ